ncbi:MAG TPA: SpoIIE family protein phosphatase, partial [Kofleriaceae bacterium]|nr:SpoIIE family protein phosphatase [Kofleriaceae bacterium]
ARTGISISAKLILTTSVVVAVAVAAATWFSQRTIDELTERQLANRRTSGEKSITRESELVVQAVATAVALPLAQSTYPDIAPVLDAAMRDDHGSGDDRLQWLVVTDTTGQVVAATRSAPAADRLAGFDRQLTGGVRNGDVVHVRIGTGSDWVYGAPIKLGDSQVGTLHIGVSTAGLEAELARSLALANERSQESQQRLLLIAAGVLLVGILFAALQGVGLARPIRALTVQAKRIASGDLQSRVPEGRRDELGVLAKTFNVMANEIQHLLAEQRQKVSLEKEMELARQVQQAMLPPSTLDQHGHLKIVGTCMPASQCGGDWWMYRKLSGGRMLLVLGDATGHGIHSAMIAATARGAVEALAAVDERLLTPDQVLRAIDQSIRMVGDHNVLMTAFAAVFDSRDGALHYANAGQNFPYVMKAGATRVLESASIIAASGNPLGDRNIATEIRRGSMQLAPGDLFVCFTDGVVERANKQGKLFGDRRLRGSLTGQAVPDASSLVQLRDHVLATLERYAEGGQADDDITLVLCQFDPPSRSKTVTGTGLGRGAA